MSARKARIEELLRRLKGGGTKEELIRIIAQFGLDYGLRRGKVWEYLFILKDAGYIELPGEGWTCKKKTP